MRLRRVSSTNLPRLVCKRCQLVIDWRGTLSFKTDSQTPGPAWADEDGEPFKAYYCELCRDALVYVLEKIARAVQGHIWQGVQELLDELQKELG